MLTLVSLPNDIIERLLVFVLRHSLTEFQNVTVTCRGLRTFYVILFRYHPVHISSSSQYHAFIASRAYIKNSIETLKILGKYVKNFPVFFSFNRLTTLCLKGLIDAISTCISDLPPMLQTLKILVEMKNFKRNWYRDANRSISEIESTNINASCRLKTICVMSESICIVSRGLSWPLKGIIGGRRADTLGAFLRQLLYIFRNSLRYIELVRIDLALIYTPQPPAPQTSATIFQLPRQPPPPLRASTAAIAAASGPMLQAFPHLETIIIDSASHKNANIWKFTPSRYTIFWVDYLDLFIYIRRRNHIIPWLVIAPEDIKQYPIILCQIPTTLRLYAGIQPSAVNDLATIFQIDRHKLNRLSRFHID